MFGVALLVFREVLEAALIVTIVAAATRGVTRRGVFIGGGIALGVLGAIVVALFAGVIEEAVNGSGQELFNACVLLAAVGMIAWHVIWMSSHGRELVQQMQAVGHAVKTGSSSVTILLAVVALAVLREGSEIVLFLYGMAAGGAGLRGLCWWRSSGTRRRHRCRVRPVFRLAADSHPLLLHRHQLDVGAAGGGTRFHRGAFPDPGQLAARVGQPALEYFLAAQQRFGGGAGLAHPGRLRRASGGHANGVLVRDGRIARHRHAGDGDASGVQQAAHGRLSNGNAAPRAA